MTTFEFYKKFDTEQKCIDFLTHIRWGGEIKCPHCGHRKYYIINAISRQGKQRNVVKDISAKEYKCANQKCYKKFSAKTNTIFHSCKVPLSQFFFIIFSSCINKKNISSHQQKINLGIHQATAWAMMARIRVLCKQDESLKLSGEIEIDETYLRSAKWKAPRIREKPQNRKFPILGLLQRGGKLVIKVIPTKDKRTVQKIIFNHVEVGSRIITDSAPCYFGLSSYYRHDSVNHRDGEYVRGDVYTNGIEGVWNHFKKAIVGTHHGVSQSHLQGYCDEFAYRFNNKHLSAEEKFLDLMKRACSVGKVGIKDIIRDVKKNRILTTDSKYSVLDTSTGYIYGTISEAAIELGYTDDYLRRILRGTSKSKKNNTHLIILDNF